MRAVILAAGRGRRIAPLSDACHKGLLDVAGSMILTRLVASLRRIDVDAITVVTGYRAEDVREHLFGCFPDTPFSFVHNPRYEQTNNVVSLALALDSLPGDEDVVLAECDALLEPAAMAALGGPVRGSVALVDHYRTGMDGTVVSVEDGVITQVHAPADQGPGFRYDDKLKTLNVYRFDRAFCRRVLRPLVRWYADEIDETSYYELVLGMLANIPSHRIAAAVVPPGSWMEVDDPNDLVAARFKLEPGRRAEILDRSSAVTGASTSSTSRSWPTGTSRRPGCSRRCGMRCPRSWRRTAPRSRCSTRSSLGSRAATRRTYGCCTVPRRPSPGYASCSRPNGSRCRRRRSANTRGRFPARSRCGTRPASTSPRSRTPPGLLTLSSS
jgi:choline kinase